MRRPLLVLALALASCATPTAVPFPTPTALAQTQAASPIPAALPSAEGTSFDPSAAPAGAYVLDPRHASVIWRVRHMGLSLYVGRFDGCLQSQGAQCPQPGVSSTITFNPQNPEQSAVTATIQVNALSTGLTTGNGERGFDREIANVLSNNGAAPTITFTSTSVTRTGDATGLMTGDLTLHGQTHPVTFEVSFQGGKAVALRGGKYVLAFSARTIINRNQWGAGSLIFNQFASDETEIVINGEFVQQ
ncbi:MAG TPA: YceI family protein [Caulobacterales bacterium]|nr:YceI family protein [Caulobacterales bacterium]